MKPDTSGAGPPIYPSAAPRPSLWRSLKNGHAPAHRILPIPQVLYFLEHRSPRFQEHAAEQHDRAEILVLVEGKLIRVPSSAEIRKLFQKFIDDEGRNRVEETEYDVGVLLDKSVGGPLPIDRHDLIAADHFREVPQLSRGRRR